MATSEEFVASKPASELRPGDRFVFAEDLGGEGEVVTVASTGDAFSTLAIETDELDFDIEVVSSQMVTIAPEEEEEEPTSEYTERREKLAEFLCNLVYGEGAWGEAEEDTRLNYRLDAQDIIKANPHLLSLTERERLGDSIPELAYDTKEGGDD